MATFLFVHGTGVRKDSFEETLAGIEKQLVRHDDGSSIQGCFWGGKGATLPEKRKSIPTYDTTKSLGGTTPEEQAVALWEMLYDDPLFELRLMARPMTDQAAGQPPAQGAPPFGPSRSLAANLVRDALNRTFHVLPRPDIPHISNIRRWSS